MILALNLYFECGGSIPSGSDPRVRELSDFLRSFPHHNVAARQPSFRNFDGVAFKLQNLKSFASGTGLKNVSKMDREVWEEFGASPSRVKAAAQLIRASVQQLRSANGDPDEDEDEGFAEGRAVAEVHRRLERQPKLRSLLIQKRRNESKLFCEICARKVAIGDQGMAEAIFEAHHLVPLAVGNERRTKISDMALLCACCHRQIHKAIAMQRRWLSIEEAKKIINFSTAQTKQENSI